MFRRLKLLLLGVLALAIGGSISNGAYAGSTSSSEEIVWLRPIKELCHFQKDSVLITFYPNEVVQVQAANNGNIIFQGETLATDSRSFTDYKKKFSISKKKLEESELNINEIFCVYDSTQLIVNIDSVKVPYSLRIFHSKDTEGKMFEKGFHDTLQIADWKGLSLSDTLRVARDSFPSEVVVISQLVFNPREIIQEETNENDTEEIGLISKFWSKICELSWMIWAIIGLIFLALVLILWYFFIFRKESKNEKSPEQQTAEPRIQEPAVDSEPSPTDGEQWDEPEIVLTEPTIEEQIAALKKEKENLENQLRNANANAERANTELQKVKADLKSEREDRDKLIKKKEDALKADYNRREEKIKTEAQNDIDRANKRAEKAQKEADTIEDRLTKEFDLERGRLEGSIATLKSEKNTLNGKLEETKVALATETKACNAAKLRVKQLEEETRTFKEKLTPVVGAKEYCSRIVEFVGLAKEIENIGNDMLNSGMEDLYYVYKALATYSAKLSTIKLTDFYTDIEMVSKTGFVISGTPLGTYDSNKTEAEVAELTKVYFFTNYLKTYVDAVVVLTESLAGLRYLVDDAKPSQLNAVEAYRSKLEGMTQRLGIRYFTLKVFDSIGVNTDVLATEVEAGYSKHGAILWIDNCQVNLIGGQPDNRRILVKIQK